MSDSMIKVEGLGKKYIISHEGSRGSYTALRDVISQKAKSLIKRSNGVPSSKEEFWALKDVSFEIKKGEAVGIIGRNGAGKSTLLKILSRITEPTAGRIEINGRVASLLEVGTGFHPELTGRENIFLNGAILGMSRLEIRKKFDEIVDFSGVEKFLDTPVKRYSSGMYVRLAFAVAAHLEPEILVVDEVLAVGDAEFQKKCLGKMNDVSSKEGRTVLFVSHNMAAIKNLCKVGLYLKDGQIVDSGLISTVIERYSFDAQGEGDETRKREDLNKKLGFLEWKLENAENTYSLYSRENCHIAFSFFTDTFIENAELGLVLRDFKGEIVFACNNRDNGGAYLDLKPGKHTFRFEFRFPAKQGSYEIDIAIVSKNEILDQWIPAKKIVVLSKYESHLEEKWLGTINEIPSFFHNQLSE